MSVHIRKSDGRWFCKYYVDGKEKREYTGFGDLAEQKARKLDEAKKHEKADEKTYGKTLSEICMLYHDQHQRESSTAETDYYRLTAIILPRLGNLYAEALSTDQLNRYVQIRFEAGRKRSTIAREISILKAAFTWAEQQDPPLIIRNVLARYHVPKAKERDIPAHPSRDELERIIAHAQPHLARALIIHWYTGMRPGGEMTRLRWYDVNFETGTLRVTGARKGGPAIRMIPIAEQLVEELHRWQADDSATKPERRDIATVPIVHYKFNPVASLKRSWATAKKKAGVTRRLRLYDLRHAFATYSLGAGADLKSVSNIMGHSREDTTVRMYQAGNLDHQRTAIAKIPGVTIVSLRPVTKKRSAARNGAAEQGD